MSGQRHASRFHPAVHFGLAGLATVLCAAGLARAQPADSSMSFFITGSSPGTGGNLGGLSGADAHCQSLADSVGAGDRIWRAYLSTQAVGETPAVNARDRIGTGPWFNAEGVLIAADVEELHGTNNLNKQTALTHRGAVVNGRGDSPNLHDIVTGTKADGTAPAPGADSTCGNWTSDAGAPSRAIVGHHDRMGISSNIDPQSWTEAHVTGGCTQANLQAGGGAGYFYCFAADGGSTGIRLREAAQRLGNVSRAPYLLRHGDRRPRVVYRFELAAKSRVEVRAHDLEGKARALLLRGSVDAGAREVRWDGTGFEGEPLPAGLYLIALKVLD